MDQESKKDTILARYQDALAEISRLKEVLYQYKEYDILTGLYNKSTFETKVRNLLDHAQNAKYAIICADIEQFKVINDLYGIKKGDDILRHIGKSLWSLFYPKDWIVARFSADMFLMCVPEERKEDVVVHILELFNEMEIKITPAIGVYTIADKTMPIPYMCDNALMALKSIKQNYRIHYAMFQEDMRTKIVSEQEILDHAQEALNKRYFQVYIQPKCDMQTGKIVGGEALVRWIDPENGMIMPKEFIPLFERNGFIKEMDLYVWKEVAKWMQSLIVRGIQPVPISVNVSRVDIMEMNVYEIFQNLIEQYWLEPSLLRIEVTESAYSNEEVLIIQEIDKMRKEGFIVLLDDFGSGYSSLNILKDINIDILKLDLHFLDKDNQKSRDIICSILNMTKWLKLNTIAEGVENATQVEFLLKIGCRFAQGYYYYKPMPIEKFEELLGESGRVEYEIENTLNQKKQMLINVKELFYENMISNSILNDVLGAVALLSYETEYVRLEKGNMQFFQMIEKDPEQVSNEENIMEMIVEEDRHLIAEAVRRARKLLDRGEEVTVRQRSEEHTLRWLHLKIFFLSKINNRELYYVSMQDISKDMKMMEELQISKKSLLTVMEDPNIRMFELDIATQMVRYGTHIQGEFKLETCEIKAPEGLIEQGIVCEDSLEDFRQMYQKIFDGAESVSQVIHAKMEGQEVYHKIVLKTVKNQEGVSVKAVGTIENISEKKASVLKNEI